MGPREPIWADLARPLLLRLDQAGRWQAEARATKGIPFPDMRVASAARVGLVQRRRHWLTGQMQIRLAVPGWDRAKVGLPR
jgi:hypothetical protein